MGNLESFIKSFMEYLATETDDEEKNGFPSLNSYNLKSPEKARGHNFLGSPNYEWQNRSRSDQMKYLTVTVPEHRRSSSLASTSVQDKLKSSAAIVKLKAEGRWMKHYSSCHRILLVGEGDFSFSACLASAFGRASNMVATSLDSQAFVVKNYRSGLYNLVELSKRKCKVMHEVDATQMATHHLLSGMKFDRIVFNFPFAGFFKELPRQAQIRLHRRLVSGFMENAKEMLSENGEIHITHKSNGFHKEWKLEALGGLHRLMLIEAVDFDKVEWAGYNTKCGFGGDNNFNCNPSITYKFRL
ncbi:uncharacterized protein At4g26485-like [Salvia miltiorrhiza]|uniref:uncharacterized protein At4g26485-like n=1 Tax=Salvia miltiorrhiza TaxID=226208 RepID=UPI0025AD78B3|nr:uncharacterized protein At4g26485-like [Salvia miltiorrhiza]